MPLRVAPYEGESGIGFCVRAATENGGRLAGLRHLLGLGEGEHLKDVHAEKLARLLDTDVEFLRRSLASESGRTQGRSVCCYGHNFCLRSALRLRRPQVCLVCLSTSDYARAEWDLSLSTICVSHHVRLVDQCPTCSALCRWERPSIRWGHCGHQLVALALPSIPSNDAVIAQKVLGSLLQHQGISSILPRAGLAPWLAELSLDGWINLITSFGLLSREYEVPPRGVFTKVPSSTDAYRVVERGMSRLREWSSGTDSFKDAHGLVSDTALSRLVVKPSGPRDREIGLRLYSAIFGRDAVLGLKRRHPEVTQLDLFVDSV